MKSRWGILVLAFYSAVSMPPTHAQSPSDEITVTDAYGTFSVRPHRTTIPAVNWQRWFTLNEDRIHELSSQILRADPLPSRPRHSRRDPGAGGLVLSASSILPTTLTPFPDLNLVPTVGAPPLSDPFFGMLPIFNSVITFIRDFIERFRENNDRGFANLTNFRAEFTQSLVELDGGRGRLELVIEAYRHYRINNISFNIEAGGAGVRVLYDPDPERMLTLGIAVLPAYGEIRNLLFGGVGSIGNDFLVRASASGLISVRPTRGVEVGAVVAFQPQWINFGHFRSLQEIYARLTMVPDRYGNDQFYVQELVFIPRIVHWVNTDPTIGMNPSIIGWVSDEARTLSVSAPELISPPGNELILMGSLGFRFSL